MMLKMTAPECMARWVAGVAATLLAGALAAQPVYRIVGADGRVTYADTPPAVAGQNKVKEAGRAPEADLAVPLPFSLRAVASQYPVTLYTTANCAGPCWFNAVSRLPRKPSPARKMPMLYKA